MLYGAEERNCYVDNYDDSKGPSGHVMRPQPFQMAEAASPAVRFREVLWLMSCSLPLSGVIRTEGLRAPRFTPTAPERTRYSWRRLALKGPFQESSCHTDPPGLHPHKTTRERAEHEAGGRRRPAGQKRQKLHQDDSSRSTWPAGEAVFRPHRRTLPPLGGQGLSSVA